MPNSFYQQFGKRIFDIISASLGLLFLLPLFLVVSIWIKFSSKGTVFYIQKRIGLNFKEFNLYKFRSMVSNASQIGLELTTSDDLRITEAGKIIRKYKIDELPQLFNVIKGDMSLVGPRPEVERYTSIFKEEFRFILGVRPGITDFSSLKYRNENELLTGKVDTEKYYLDFILPDKLRMNREYVKKVGFIQDIKIVFLTVKNTFVRKNVFY